MLLVLIYSHPFGSQKTGFSYPPASTNTRNCLFVTGVLSMAKGCNVTDLTGCSSGDSLLPRRKVPLESQSYCLTDFSLDSPSWIPPII